MEKKDKEPIDGEVLEQQLKSNYKAMNTNKKKEFYVKILGDKGVLKNIEY